VSEAEHTNRLLKAKKASMDGASRLTPAHALIKQALLGYLRECANAESEAEDRKHALYRLVIKRLATRVDQLEGKVQAAELETQLSQIWHQEQVSPHKLAADQQNADRTRLPRNMEAHLASTKTPEKTQQ